MRIRLWSRILVAVCLAATWTAWMGAQGPVRIFGTNAAGQSIPVQVAADGSLKLTLAVSGYEFEGATDDAFETSLVVVDPTADRTITLPDATGTVALVENTLAVFAATTSAQLAGVLSNETGTGVAVFGTAPVFTTSATVGLIASQDIIKLLPVTDDDRFTATITVADLASDQTYTLPITGGTFAVTVDKLSAFAATTSAELAGVLSDESGSGVVAYATSPIFTTDVTVGLIATQDVIKILAVTDDDRFTGTLTVADLSEDRTWTLPNLAGTLAVVGVANAGTLSATGFLVGTNAGVDKTCTAADAVITVEKGIITAVTCTTAAPEPAPAAGLASASSLR